MTNKEIVFKALREVGKQLAQDFQENSSSYTNTEIYSDEYPYIPSFEAAKEVKNMLQRQAGFVCKNQNGIVVKLLQPYDSDIYTQDPLELPAQWGFKWPTIPEYATEFIASSTSPYGKGEYCKENNVIYKSLIDNNVWAPSAYPQGWEEYVVNN